MITIIFIVLVLFISKLKRIHLFLQELMFNVRNLINLRHLVMLFLFVQISHFTNPLKVYVYYRRCYHFVPKTRKSLFYKINLSYNTFFNIFKDFKSLWRELDLTTKDLLY